MTADDPRPGVWIGHAVLPTPDIEATEAFMVGVGMRPIERGDGFAVLELRGGTHLVLVPGEAVDDEPADFDLMVDDLDATHAAFVEDGLAPSKIERQTIHDSFSLRAPSGHVISFNSTHVSDRPV